MSQATWKPLKPSTLRIAKIGQLTQQHYKTEKEIWLMYSKKRLRHFIEMTEKNKLFGFGGIEKHF